MFFCLRVNWDLEYNELSLFVRGRTKAAAVDSANDWTQNHMLAQIKEFRIIAYLFKFIRLFTTKLDLSILNILGIETIRFWTISVIIIDYN